ncbi:unnamed protein product [Arabidopsis halleri]
MVKRREAKGSSQTRTTQPCLIYAKMEEMEQKFSALSLIESLKDATMDLTQEYLDTPLKLNRTTTEAKGSRKPKLPILSYLIYFNAWRAYLRKLKIL